MIDPFALIELWIVVAFLIAWAILEWQGRRLDRLRRERDQGTPQSTDITHSSQETRD